MPPLAGWRPLEALGRLGLEREAKEDVPPMDFLVWGEGSADVKDPMGVRRGLKEGAPPLPPKKANQRGDVRP